MAAWFVNKKEKTIYLAGDYSERDFFPQGGKDPVYISDCVDTLDKSEINWFLEGLLINPFSEYTFKCCKEAMNRHLCVAFTSARFFQVYEINEEGNGVKGSCCHFTQSSSCVVNLLESFFHIFGYKTNCLRNDYHLDEYMREDGFEPAYYYGLGRGCTLYVKKIKQ